MDEELVRLVEELEGILADIRSAEKRISDAESVVYQTQNDLTQLKVKQKGVFRNLEIALGYFQG